MISSNSEKSVREFRTYVRSMTIGNLIFCFYRGMGLGFICCFFGGVGLFSGFVNSYGCCFLVFCVCDFFYMGNGCQAIVTITINAHECILMKVETSMTSLLLRPMDNLLLWKQVFLKHHNLRKFSIF